MVGGSYGVISKRFPEYSVGALLAVVVAQGMSRSSAFPIAEEFPLILPSQVSVTA